MPKTWTVEQVLALSPDASSTAAAKGLSTPRKWITLGSNDDSAWGECQGSGKNPYQTQIDLNEPAFKCSCPSRKFPCKHALALFLLFANDKKSFTQTSPPQWVTDWIVARAKRAEQKETKAEAKAEKAADPVAQAKRQASREAKVSAGLQDLELWLCDLTRNGFASVQTHPYSFWEQMAARMVDAQAPGISRIIKNIPSVISSGEGWQERLLKQFSSLYILLESYKRIESLSTDSQADIRAMIGWTQDQDDLLKQEHMQDLWIVAGQNTYEEDRLRVQRTWLIGCNSGRNALIVSFAHMSQPMIDTSLMTGIILDADLVFFPGSYPLRALIKNRRTNVESPKQIPAFQCCDDMMCSYAKAIALNPWILEFPVMLSGVIPVLNADRWSLCDNDGYALPIHPNYKLGWNLLAISGGHPISIFSEWNGEWLNPLSAWSGSQFHILNNSGGLN